MNALNVIKHSPFKMPLFAPRPGINVQDFLREDTLKECLELAEKLTDCDSRLRRLASLEARENSVIESLLPWEPMALPLNSEGTKTAGIVYGALPPSTDFTELERALDDAVPEAQVFEISSDKDQLCVLVVYLREKEAAVYDFLRTVNSRSLRSGTWPVRRAIISSG